METPRSRAAAFAASILDVREAAGQNGVYSLSIPFPQGKGKKYQLVYENYTAVDDIGGIDLSERQIVKYIATAEETQNALSEINQASADTILDVLNQNQVILETRQFDPEKDRSVAVILIANRPAQGFSNFDELEKSLKWTASPGDLIITVGAGDIYKIGERLVAE